MTIYYFGGDIIREGIMPDFDFYSIQFNGTYGKFYRNISMEEF